MQTIVERLPEVVRVIAHDDHTLGWKPKLCQLAREKGAVGVADVAPDELRAGQKDVGAGFAAHEASA